MSSETQNDEARNDGKDFVQIRHKEPMELSHPRELVVAVPPMHSNVNLSRIVRAAGCCGVRKIICCGNASVNAKIARETGIDLEIEQHRTLAPELLRKWKTKGWRVVGLEQTNDSYWLHEYAFPEKTLLVVETNVSASSRRSFAVWMMLWKSQCTGCRFRITRQRQQRSRCTSTAASIRIKLCVFP